MESIYHSPSDYADKWYCDLLGLEFLYKYPTDFIEWIDEPDTWGLSIAKQNKINHITKLFDLWVNEKF